MAFKIGDTVSILNEVGKYQIIGISGSIVHIEDEHGFDRKMDSKYVVPQRKIQHSNIDLHQKDSNEIKSQSSSKPKIEIYEIDLHIESLFARNLEMSAHEKFLCQIDAFKAFTNKMIHLKQKKFRIIHGAGEGKLKDEIRHLLKARNGFTMHDDQYSFGKIGASLIEMQLSVVERF
ncbi:MAG: hypothetical protein EBQ94_07865 [Flavobacteriales bacterium]|nr:hypothetical protein [Crocinitomicaceae bacterium]NBX80276.1 hypothetical protein [Flavobacteriales bacterium]NCA20259.1 hypothetical protein [Crocinitomicaceae bacterium]